MSSTIKCDLCSKVIDNVAAKIYMTEVIPGKPAIMANYKFHSDLCSSCAQTLSRKMTKRKKRKTIKDKFPLRSDT